MSGGSALVIMVAPPLASSAVRILGRTLRLTIAGAENLGRFWTAGRPLIYAAWHGRILMLPWVNARLRRTLGARPVRVLASQSRDGEILARYVRRFGLGVVRGSSSRGGTAALRALIRAVRAGDDVAVIPDGPRGPRAEAHPGAVVIAAATGAPIVPLAFAAWPARRMRTWDEFLIPAPFARSAVVFGPTVTVRRGADLDRVRKELEQTLIDTTATADRLVSE